MALWERLFRRSIRAPASLERVESLMEQGDYEQAETRIREALRGTTGVVAASLLGNLGECTFQLGKAASALESTKQAMEQALEADDADLIATLRGNLYEIHRYLGDPLAAADQAEELSTLALARGDEPGARRYLRQSVLVREGEPLLRVVAAVEDRRYEIDEVLAGIVGPIRLVYERNRLTLRLADRWAREGEQFAQAGTFGPARELYQRAAKLDPFAPDPAYQAGMVLAHEGHTEEARDQFQHAEELAPGWFHVRSALALLRAGLPAEPFRIWHAVAEGPLPHEAKRQLCEQLLPVVPHAVRGYIYLHLGKALHGLKRLGAERAFRLGLEHAVEPDLLTRLCVELASVVMMSAEKARLLHRALEINGDLVAVGTAKIFLAFE